MPDSYFEYINTPTDTSFTFPFRFIALGDVHVLGFNETSSVYTDLDSAVTVTANANNQGGTVTFPASWNSESLYNTLRIYRATSTTQLVDFENGSRLTATDLDNAYQQSLYVAQEVTEDANTFQFKLQKNLTDTALTNVVSFRHTDLTGDGTATVFNLSFTPATETPEAFLVSIDGAVQAPDAYTIAISIPSTITFASAPPASAVITVVTLASSNTAATVDDVTVGINQENNKISVKDGGVTETKLGTGSVTETKLGTGSVTEAKLGTGSVTEAKLGTGSVTSDKLGTDSVTSDKLGTDSVTTAKIADGSVTEVKLGTGSVTETKLGTGSVTETKLGTGSVTETKLGTGSVTETKLGTGSVTADKLGTGSVTTDKIGTQQVTQAKIENLSVSGGKISNNTITPNKLSLNASGDYLDWDTSTGNIRIGEGVAGSNIWKDVDLRGVISIGERGAESDFGFIHQDPAGKGVCITGQDHRIATAPDLTVQHGGNVVLGKELHIDGNVVLGKELHIGTHGATSEGVVLKKDQLKISANNNVALEVNRHQGGGVVNFQKAGTTVGQIKVLNSSTQYNTSSDYRLKESLQDIEDADEKVLSLKPINFKWKASDERVDGFLAHEVQAIVPEAVSGEKDGEEMQGIDQSKLVPLLTAALQDALKSIKSLEERVTALES